MKNVAHPGFQNLLGDILPYGKMDEIIQKDVGSSKNKSNFLSSSTFEILDLDVKKKLVTSLILNNEDNISQHLDEEGFLSKSTDDLLDWVHINIKINYFLH